MLAAALLAWLLAGRRRKAVAAPSRRVFDSEALAASMAPPVATDRMADDAQPVDEVGELPAQSPEPMQESAPAWHSGARPAAPAGPVAAPAAERASSHAPLASALAGVAAPTTASQRFKLVRAFLDIGDDESARQLLGELLEDPDPAARADAARMLQELG